MIKRRRMNRAAAALLATAVVAGCTLAPRYRRPELPTPHSWPAGDPYLLQSEAALPSISYRDVFKDERLQALISQALANNRDLRIAAANVLAARAKYRIQRAELLPEVDLTGRYTRSEGSSTAPTTVVGGSAAGTTAATGGTGTAYSVDLGITAFELDLFGRIRSLTGAALNRYFETEAAARATHLTLIANIADAWLNYAADASLLKIAQDTSASAGRSVTLTRARLEGGVAPRTDLRQAETVLATAQADLAQQRSALAQDINALQLLIGAPVDPVNLPMSIETAGQTLAVLPAGLDSTILLRRPDVVEAEYELRATNAEIGAARAELFPVISLTGLLGYSSSALSSLFDRGSFNWSVSPSVNYPIFRAAAGVEGVRYTKAQRDAALATYERAIQTAFREIADALARRGTIDEQVRASGALKDAAADTFTLADARYRGGVDTFLSSLDAQRSLYSAQRTLAQTQLAEASNRVALYTAIGGDMTQDAR